MPPPSLAGRVAVVTGATGGIGRAAAEAFAAAGCHIVLSSRDEKRLDSLADRLAREHGVRTLARACDVRSPEQVAALGEAVRAAFGRVDVLVNNAGLGIGGAVLDLPVAHWDEQMEVNLRGPFLMVQALGPLLGAGANVLNIASVAAHDGFPGQAAYCASKAGLLQFSKALGQELAPRGVRVVAVCPGYVATPMVEGAGARAEDMVQPGHLAEVLVWLAAQPDSVYVDEVTVWPRRMYTS